MASDRPSEGSILEQCCTRLAKEMGIPLSAATPSQSFVYGRTGMNGAEQLEYWIVADNSEHVRLCTTNERPYLVLSGERPGASEYRLCISVPSKSLAGFLQEQCDRHDAQKWLNVFDHDMLGRIWHAMHDKTALQDEEAAFKIQMSRDDLRLLTREVLRAYIH